jgi:outer membrane lipoprotein SlyB
VSPSPVGIDGNGTGDVAACAAGGALGPLQRGMRLGGEGASLLGAGGAQNGAESGELLEHGHLDSLQLVCRWSNGA